MRVLIDTDVLLDVALGREPWDEASGAFLDLCQQGGCTAFVAWHSISNLYYYLAGKRKQDARAFIADLLAFVEVAPVAQQDMRFALEQDLPDFEDAMQVAAAPNPQQGAPNKVPPE